VAVIGGVCAGVVGWVLRERGMVGKEKRREERSFLNSGDVVMQVMESTTSSSHVQHLFYQSIPWEACS